jgi:sigma-B regulation protein RsbU (phosphoserine phosphatase)
MSTTPKIATLRPVALPRPAIRPFRHGLDEGFTLTKREMELALRVQQGLVPQPLSTPHFAVETFYRPARLIGGDFGLVMPAEDGALDIVVCDVSGHGLGAGLVANRIYAQTVALLEQRASLAGLLRRLNGFVRERINVSGFFFTMAAARLYPDGRLAFAGAGHPPALWLGHDGECRWLEARNSALGFFVEAVAESPVEEFTLRPGDRLVLYTDGMMETFAAGEDLLGPENFLCFSCRNAKQPIEGLKNAILEHVDAHAADEADDRTLILLEKL